MDCWPTRRGASYYNTESKQAVLLQAHVANTEMVPKAGLPPADTLISLAVDLCITMGNGRCVVPVGSGSARMHGE